MTSAARDPLPLDLHGAGVDVGHVEDVFDEQGQPLEFDHRGAALGVPLLLAQPAAKILDRQADRGERRAHVVAHRCQQRFGEPGARTLLRRRRQLAGHHGHGEKHGEHDPVLRIGDEERTHRLDEEEVEGQHRHDGRHHRDSQTGKGGGGQDDQQEQQSDRRGADARDAAQQFDGGRDTGQPAEHDDGVAADGVRHGASF